MVEGREDLMKMAEYIERTAVVRYLKGYSQKELNSMSPYGMITSRLLDKVERALSEMPAADVQPVVHAEWIGFTRSVFRGCDYKCSHCGRNTVVRDNFCPNCGARMRGTSND